MIYPEHFEEKIGFNEIREQIGHYCTSESGLRLVEKMSFSPRLNKAEKWLVQTAEFLRLVQAGEPFPALQIPPILDSLKKSRVEGTFLTEEELFSLRLFLQTLKEVTGYFKKFPEYENLESLSAEIQVPMPLLNALDQVLDERGQVKDNASEGLLRIRQQQQKTERQLRKMADKLFREAAVAGYVPSDASLTVRDGRLVIPILAEHKRRLKGFVQDESASGQTVFIEPAETLEINNELQELRYAERREIVKILTQLTDKVRAERSTLERAQVFLGIIDFVRAKALFAQDIKACLPQLSKSRVLHAREARHPLLLLAHRKTNKPVVPMELELNTQQRMIIISGPNAGGKSVTLKTVGLLQYMLQCGVLIPVHPDSTFSFFEKLFIDIGDEQSIENDLSTYSSHLKNMQQFVFFADKKTLLLMDEFGSGTEPQFGGALAEAVLEKLYQQKCFGIITTHYENIKQFATTHPGVINGGMRFDQEKLAPLYQLEVGKPGSSYAFELAEKMGIPKEIIQQARKKVGRSRVDYDRLLNKLEREKQSYEKEMKRLEKEKQQLEEQSSEYAALNQYLSEQKAEILRKAKAEAKAILQQANKTVENTIREIKESGAKKEATKAAREKLQQERKTFEQEVEQEPGRPKETAEYTPATGPIEVGSWVKLKGQEAIGQVLSLSGKDAEVSLGQLKSMVKLKKLEKVSRKAAKKQEKRFGEGKKSGNMDLNSKMVSFSTRLDLRGKRAEEALIELDKYLDDAVMLGQPEVSILHGRGDGVLRDLVRNHLRSLSFVRHFESEHVERGGDGITLVQLK